LAAKVIPFSNCLTCATMLYMKTEYGIVTSKGQIVIPVGIRKRHHIESGTRVRFEDLDGGIVVRPVTEEAIDRVCGIASGLGLPPGVERDPDSEIA